jgi:hypothetical protein
MVLEWLGYAEDNHEVAGRQKKRGGKGNLEIFSW